jgi:hypothetical protein
LPSFSWSSKPPLLGLLDGPPSLLGMLDPVYQSILHNKKEDMDFLATLSSESQISKFYSVSLFTMLNE